MINKEIILLGYTKDSHTNWYPWNCFKNTFNDLGYQSRWVELSNFRREEHKTYIFICWNQPDAYDLINREVATKDDIIIQKVTSMTKRDTNVNWGEDPFLFYKNWHWPAYQMCVDILEKGYNLFCFGCKSDYKSFKTKEKLVNKLGDRLFWVPWTTCMYSYEQLQKQKPIVDSFLYDSAFVGSIWGTEGRGNLDSIQSFLNPILQESEEFFLAGMGTPRGPVSNKEHVEQLKRSKLCPVINASSWRAEKGVQDRFWTVFSSGRFGVSDTEGVYDFFHESEVVCETDPAEYIEKSLYYMKNIEKQINFIEKIQTRIKKEYNWNYTWNKILKNIK